MAVVGLISSGSLADADYIQDRQWRDLSPQQLLRVYPARSRAGASCGRRVDDCIQVLGRQPDERRRVSPTDEVLVFRGTKTLYRGTGASNEATGPEWMEVEIHDGVVSETVRVIQVYEIGSPWAPSLGSELFCEPYGAKGSSSCPSSLTPIGDLPDVSSPGKPPFDYGCAAGTTLDPAGSEPMTALDAVALGRTVVAAAAGMPQLGPFQTKRFVEAEGPTFVLGQEMTRNQDEPTMVTASCKPAVRLDGGRREFGGLVVAVCDRTSELSAGDFCGARTRLTSTLLVLGFDPTTRKTDAIDAMMRRLEPSHARLSDDVAVEYAGFLAIGHGIAVLPTLIATRPGARDAIVLQLQDENLCNGREREQQPLCTNTKGVMTELGRRLASQLLPSS